MTPQVQEANALGSPEDVWIPTYGSCVLWLFLAGLLGFFLSQPYRTKLIIEQTLPWPSPTATAVVLQTLHGHDASTCAQCHRASSSSSSVSTTSPTVHSAVSPTGTISPTVHSAVSPTGTIVTPTVTLPCAQATATAELVSGISSSTAAAFAWQWLKWLVDGTHQVSQGLPVFGRVAAQYSISTDFSPAYMANGMLTTTNVVWSMALGGAYGFGFLYPLAEAHRGTWFPTDARGLEGAKAYWFLSSLAMLLTESLYQAIKIIGQSLEPCWRGSSWSRSVWPGLFGLFTKVLPKVPFDNPEDPEENTFNENPRLKEQEPPWRLVPRSFWLPAFIGNTVLLMIVLPQFFPIPWYLIPPTVLLSIPLGYGICLGGALTGTFLISGIGKLLIVALGLWCPSVLGALWVAGLGMITVGSNEQLLVDYQVAHVTHTSPRELFQAQVIAATVGFIVTPLSFGVFLEAFPITESGAFTAPGGVALRALAVSVVSSELQLPQHLSTFLGGSILLALSLSLAQDLLSESSRWHKWVPTTSAFAIGFFVNGSFPLNALMGWTVKRVWQYWKPGHEQRLGPVVAGGWIAGEGLAAIAQAVFAIAGIHPSPRLAIDFH